MERVSVAPRQHRLNDALGLLLTAARNPLAVNRIANPSSRQNKHPGKMIPSASASWLAYLILLLSVSWSTASPVQQPFLFSNKETQVIRLCGNTLDEFLRDICKALNTYHSATSSNISNDLQHSSVFNSNLCCDKGCTISYLKSFCFIQNRTTEEKRSLDVVTSKILHGKDNKSQELLPQLTTASPVYHLCGDALSNYLRDVCEVYHSLFPSISGDVQRRPKATNGNISHECCIKGCTKSYLNSFCSVLKNRTELEENKILEWGKVKPQPDVSPSEAPLPTDPPNKPEFVYAGEYWDQEPLTLVPTYTSPEYTAINHLIKL